jgi:hypothetical protein
MPIIWRYLLDIYNGSLVILMEHFDGFLQTFLGNTLKYVSPSKSWTIRRLQIPAPFSKI